VVELGELEGHERQFADKHIRMFVVSNIERLSADELLKSIERVQRQ
jgi:hypothetical protein